MLTFLFWNLNGKNLSASLARLVSAYSVDVLILAEATAPEVSPELLVPALITEEQNSLYYAPDRCQRVQMFLRFPGRITQTLLEDAHYTIRSLAFPDRPEVLLVGVHMLSPLHATPDTLYSEIQILSSAIRRIEEEIGHTRTIVVGDLNMNPFENGVVSASGLHGVMSKRLALTERREVQAREYPFFYNPMWSRMGDHEGRIPGTYYYRHADHVCYFWNIFDQVLLRPIIGLLGRQQLAYIDRR